MSVREQIVLENASRTLQGMRTESVTKIRVAFEFGYQGSLSRSVFECMTCDELLVWAPSQGWFYCPTCGYELLPSEAERVAAFAQRQLQALLEDVQLKNGRRRWGLVTWLRQLFRRRV